MLYPHAGYTFVAHPVNQLLVGIGGEFQTLISNQQQQHGPQQSGEANSLKFMSCFCSGFFLVLLLRQSCHITSDTLVEHGRGC
jgi:hypothetical protein